MASNRRRAVRVETAATMDTPNWVGVEEASETQTITDMDTDPFASFIMTHIRLIGDAAALRRHSRAWSAMPSLLYRYRVGQNVGRASVRRSNALTEAGISFHSSLPVPNNLPVGFEIVGFSLTALRAKKTRNAAAEIPAAPVARAVELGAFLHEIAFLRFSKRKRPGEMPGRK